MTILADRLKIPLPKQMRTLARDVRGYPIPFIVLMDKNNQPQFTINDVRKTMDCRSKKLCAICGKRLEPLMWFVGGSRCFLHERGAFIDPPLHYACAEYALKVCPFLAAPSYTKRLEDKKLKPSARPDGLSVIRVDHMKPLQPEYFGLGATYQWQAGKNSSPATFYYIVPHWEYVEWWKNGQRVNAPDRSVPKDMPIYQHGRS